MLIQQWLSSGSAVKHTAEAGGFLVKQKGRAGGGRKKKPRPSSREGTPDQMEGSPAGAAAGPEAEGTQASPSPSPAVEGGRTGNPFEEEEREAVPGLSAWDSLTMWIPA